MSLFSVCGIDGCGKSMQVRMLSDALSAQGYDVAVSKAYDDQMKIGVGSIVEEWTDQNAIMFIFQAMHARQYSDTVAAIAAGKVVIADRWDENYLAYHRNFGDLASNPELRGILNDMAYRSLLPKAGFVLKVPPAIARARRQGRGSMGKLEDRSDEYYEVIQDEYLRIASERGWHVLDALEKPEMVHKQIVSVVLTRLAA